MAIIEALKPIQARVGVVPDGIFGPATAAAIMDSLDAIQAIAPLPSTVRAMAWGARVSASFRDRVTWIVKDLMIGETEQDGCDKLMTCMAWESGRTFSPSVRNMAGSGATGLIQFMPATARGLGTTTAALAVMTAEDQLNYVWKYFAPFKGRLKTLSDLYMAILWPAAVGKPESAELWDRNTQPTTYRQNAGLDANRDGSITKGEAAAKVAKLLFEGRQAGNLG